MTKMAQGPSDDDDIQNRHDGRKGKESHKKEILNKNDEPQNNGIEFEPEKHQQDDQIEEVEEENESPSKNIWQEIVDDFQPSKGGDNKILRALGRTALVNVAVTATSLTGGAAGLVGSLTGGAITFKRINDGIDNDDHKEVAKGFAVYSSATGASVAGQAVSGALMLGVAGASLPVAGAVAFGVGCASGITAGALSEWGIDNAWKNETTSSDQEVDDYEGEKEGATVRTEKGEIGESRTISMTCNETDKEQSNQEKVRKSSSYKWGIENFWRLPTAKSIATKETNIELYTDGTESTTNPTRTTLTADGRRSYQWDFLAETMKKSSSKRVDIFSRLDGGANNKVCMFDHSDESGNLEFRQFMSNKKKQRSVSTQHHHGD